MSEGLRVLVVGATGALGSEVLAEMERRALPVRELVPLASDRSLGCDVEFCGAVLPVETKAPSLRGFDLVFLCLPPSLALEWVADALRAQTPVFDLSGALSSRDEVPLLVAGIHQPAEGLTAPLIATPPGPALSWLRVLLPLHRHFGLRRVVATTLESAASGGRGGIESLSQESIALFNQSEPPAPETFGYPVAFDCLPWLGSLEADGATDREQQLLDCVRRVLGDEVRLAVTSVRVPTFSGDGSSLALETVRPAEPDALLEILGELPDVELEDADQPGTTRAAAGSDVVRVGRVRRDPSVEHGVLLWLATDPLLLAASNAVRLAEARLRTH